MNKILERHEKNDQYDTWFVVKQNYDFEVTKFFIKKIAQYTRIVYEGSFEKFVSEDEKAKTNKTFNNFRNAKTLIDLNLVTNDFIETSPKYNDYNIPKEILKNIEDDDKLRVEINKRMLMKQFFVVEKSNKKSDVSKKRRIVEIPVYQVLFKILKKLHDQLGSTYITDFEISNFVVLMKDESEIDDVVEVITLYRANKITLKNKITESRFSRTLNHLIPIKTTGKKNNFDYVKISEMLDGIITDATKQISEDSSDFIKRNTVSIRNSSMQSKWKRKISAKFKSKCAMCGLTHAALLKGSHIKSVSESKKDDDFKSMFDFENGLLLCANHDALFDRRLISINENGEIVGNPQGVATEMIDKELLSPKTMEYLKYHHDKFKELIK